MSNNLLRSCLYYHFTEAELLLTQQDFLTGISYFKLRLNDAKLNGSRIYSPILVYPTELGKDIGIAH